jgi:hypothetical protein
MPAAAKNGSMKSQNSAESIASKRSVGLSGSAAAAPAAAAAAALAAPAGGLGATEKTFAGAAAPAAAPAAEGVDVAERALAEAEDTESVGDRSVGIGVVGDALSDPLSTTNPSLSFVSIKVGGKGLTTINNILHLLILCF